MDPHSIEMQGGNMPMGMTSENPQSMGISMYGQPQQMMMNSMGQQPQMPMGSITTSQMNSAAANGTTATDWRIQLTREHRANLIAKIYNEMVRVSADPVPGIKLWMNVSWYELSLYKESPTQEVYINKIFTRLKSLRAQQSDMNAAMAAQGLPNQGMLFRLDFSYYNTLHLSQRDANESHVNSYRGHNQFSGSGPHPAAQQQQGQEKPASAANTPVKTEASTSVNSVAEYWQQHAALRAKHQGDVEKVHSAFKKYVDHMKGHDETEQKKKLRYLLSYVELCANILSEDKATHQARKIEELDKVFKYIVKIVNPYLKKLRTETDKRSYPVSDSHAGPSGQYVTPLDPNAGTSTSTETSSGSTIPGSSLSGFSSAMTQPQSAGQTQQQSAPTQQHSAMAVQQKQQHYMMQQRAQQMQQQQQQQHMQMQARQQHMIKQQQMMRQHQMQQKGSQQQAPFSAQQSSQMKQQHNSQNAAINQQSGQQTQQQLGQQGLSRPQQGSQSSAQQNEHVPSSQGESPSMNSNLSLGLDDPLYGSMASDLLQMPTPTGTSSGGLMDFSNTLSPTSFGGMDLLDWDDGTSGQGTSGQTTTNGDTSDLMTFVETL